jgi:hypothetical protein
MHGCYVVRIIARSAAQCVLVTSLIVSQFGSCASGPHLLTWSSFLSPHSDEIVRSLNGNIDLLQDKPHNQPINI